VACILFCKHCKFSEKNLLRFRRCGISPTGDCFFIGYGLGYGAYTYRLEITAMMSDSVSEFESTLFAEQCQSVCQRTGVSDQCLVTPTIGLLHDIVRAISSNSRVRVGGYCLRKHDCRRYGDVDLDVPLTYLALRSSSPCQDNGQQEFAICVCL